MSSIILNITIEENTVNTLKNGDLIAHLDPANLIDIYESAGAPEYFTYCENGDPETEYDVEVRNDVRADLVVEALTEFFESEDILNYVKMYADIHDQKIKEMNEKRNREDKEQAIIERKLSQIED